MSPNPSSLEADLQRLRPAALDDSLLDRLEACTADRATTLTPMEIALERRLQAIAPAALPASLLASLDAKLNAIPYPTSENIVVFPKPAPAPATPRRQANWWSAAAAVALIGALTAFLVPLDSSPTTPPITKQETHTQKSNPTSTPSSLTPAGFKPGLSEAHDQGVIWKSNDRPHRVLKFIYQDQVTLKDHNGKTYQVQQPRVEYILVPAKND